MYLHSVLSEPYIKPNLELVGKYVNKLFLLDSVRSYFNFDCSEFLYPIIMQFSW